ELIDVNTIVAREVPTARWTATSGDTPCNPKLKISAGTIIRPPPMPNSPLSTPATAPSSKYAANNNMLDLYLHVRRQPVKTSARRETPGKISPPGFRASMLSYPHQSPCKKQSAREKPSVRRITDLAASA